MNLSFTHQPPQIFLEKLSSVEAGQFVRVKSEGRDKDTESGVSGEESQKVDLLFIFLLSALK